MEWSPFQSSGSPEWAPQWMCVPCNRVVGLAQAHDRRQVVCVHRVKPSVPHWWLIVLVTQDGCGVSVVRDVKRSLLPSSTHRNQLFRIGFSMAHSTMSRLHGWSESSITLPGSGSQSWLFCPLISLALVAAERARNVISGIRRRLRSSSCTVIISSVILIPRLHVLCNLDRVVVSICQPMCKSCVLLHRSCQLCTRGCLTSARVLISTQEVFIMRNPLSDHETPRVVSPGSGSHWSWRSTSHQPRRPFSSSTSHGIQPVRQFANASRFFIQESPWQGLCVSLVSWKCLCRITMPL